MEVREGANAHYKLRDDAALAGWKSPTESDGKANDFGYRKPDGTHWLKTSGQSLLAGWTTPCDCMVKGGYAGGKFINGVPQTNRLDYAAQLAGWISPIVGDSAGIETPEAAIARTGGGPTTELSGAVRRMERE